MKKKVKKIDAKDIFRVLDTEVLPYEVPAWFSNKIFRVHCRDEVVKKHKPMITTANKRFITKIPFNIILLLFLI